MSNTIINHEQLQGGKLVNEINKNDKSVFIPPKFPEIASSEKKIHHLFTKPLVHAPGVGINPIVDAAAYIFAWMGRLVQMSPDQDLKRLHFQLMEEIKEFRVSLTTLNYTSDYLSEFSSIATYTLCTTLDEIVSHTNWGKEEWNDYRLLTAYSQEMLSKENFLMILERFIQDQEIYIDMMEFIYICLNLGANYHYSILGFNAEQLQRIMHSLYKRIYHHYGSYSRILSPYPFKIAQTNYFQPTWTASAIQQFKNKFKKYRETYSFSNEPSLLSKEIRHLKNNLHGITEYLSTKSIKIREQKINLASLPWILIAGTNGAGKSTWMENSKIKFVIDKQKIQADLKSRQLSSDWNWRVTPNAVLIDMPSNQISSKRNQYSFANEYWENLLELIIQERGPNGLDSVALVISAIEIMDKSKHAILIAQLTKKIIDLQSKFGQALPLNLIINKCDLLTGFCDFFADYTNEELFQPCGVYLPQSIKSENRINGFDKPFDMLIKRLNKQVIYHLHQERGLESLTKFNIKDFPLQVARLKENLSEVIKEVLNEIRCIKLQGFYLTSAMQAPVNNEATRLSETISNPELWKAFNIMNMPSGPPRSYFIKHLLLGGLGSRQNTKVLSTNLTKQYFWDFLYKLTRGI